MKFTNTFMSNVTDRIDTFTVINTCAVVVFLLSFFLCR